MAPPPQRVGLMHHAQQQGKVLAMALELVLELALELAPELALEGTLEVALELVLEVVLELALEPSPLSVLGEACYHSCLCHDHS